MRPWRYVVLYVECLILCFGMDMMWVGVVAKGFYHSQLGPLLRPDVQWVPGVLFYLIYVAAVLVFVVIPSVGRRSLARTMGLGAFFGVAAYAAFDLTGVAMLKGFPAAAAIVDLCWGAVLTGTVSAFGYAMARRASA